VTRARASALALVNWKGVFYERYLLDPNVTALEGANGAGKTTVMIAAYVVLMPDMSRLRFTNLGETGATGGDKGIWGRLGEPGSSSYALLEIALPSGERLLAGVELVRKSEPSVEAAPFLVSALNSEVRLQDLLLTRRDGQDEVPTAGELAENVKRVGGSLQRFATIKDYFNTLFELGITPLRLSHDDDRNKLNEMLRSSMTGGISRALTSELRSFLLREESGLGDTLTRMRGNLDACRRTRIEVGEAQRLEHEIAGVYDAGQSMFTAALLATREEAAELARGLHSAREAEQRSADELSALDQSIVERKVRHVALSERMAQKRQELKQSFEIQAQLGIARSLAEQRQKLELERLTRSEIAARALAERDHANAERALRVNERDRAREDYQASAQGLADVQKGLDELHRNAHRERRAKTRLEEARALLGDPSLSPEAAPAGLETALREIERIDSERLRLARELELRALRRAEYTEAVRALVTISGQPEASCSYELGQSELLRLARLEERQTRLAQLREAQREAELLGVRQAAARRKAAALGLLEASDAALGEALAGTERELRACEEARRAATLAVSELGAERMRLEREQRELEERAARRSAACTLLSGVEATNEPWTIERARELVLKLELEAGDLAAADRELSKRREDLLAEAAELEAHGGHFAPELLRLRDELDAELLIQRFEDIDPETAASTEAALGPLVDALLVNDATAAAALVAGRPRELESVWLVGADAELPKPSTGLREDITVAHGFGLRVTRVPAKPRLGRRARVERARALRSEAEELALRLESMQRRSRRLEAALLELRPILQNPEILGGPAIAPARESNLAALENLREKERQSAHELEASRVTLAELELRSSALRSLLLDAFLLGGRDHALAARELGAEISAAEAAGAELERVADARQSLERSLQTLRAPPHGSGAEVLEQERATLERERDRFFRIAEALREVSELISAFGSNAGERALASVALVPALEQQHSHAERVLAAAEARVEQADAAREERTSIWQAADAELAAVNAQCARLDAELSRLGIQSPAHLSLEAEKQAYAALAAEAEQCEREERELETGLVLLYERRREAAKRADTAFAELSRHEQEAEPSTRRLRELRASITHGALALPSHTVQALFDATSALPSSELWADARSKRELLLDRLDTSRSGGETVGAVRDLLGDDERSARGEAYLRAWWKVREWLQSRVPAQISDVQDPLEALERLRDHLSALERRLGRQEQDLRVASEDIARSIEVQLRRAGNQVRRLNQGLEGIHFGSIRGIRVRAERVERMAQVLRALREGDAQELLFQPALPIEDALNEVFRRYAGGRTGGHRILDYREYVELTVEVLRRSCETWELANPTRLSTGEAIGVGAALMMVVLTEWERDANLLRGKREHGSLRFLFLDEANRLSPDNLSVLFDLCQTLDLQLLIAAPEVARADGNTTYRLVRTIDENGREEVIVSGRRAAMPEPAGSAGAEAQQVAPAQSTFGFES